MELEGDISYRSDSLSDNNSLLVDFDDDQSDSNSIDFMQEEEKSNWTKYTRQNKLQFKLPNFKEKPSPRNTLKGLQLPIEFFKLFFTDEVFLNICDMTHLYYTRNNQTHKRRSHHKKWEKPDLTTIYCYFDSSFTWV